MFFFVSIIYFPLKTICLTLLFIFSLNYLFCGEENNETLGALRGESEAFSCFFFIIIISVLFSMFSVKVFDCTMYFIHLYLTARVGGKVRQTKAKLGRG